MSDVVFEWQPWRMAPISPKADPSNVALEAKRQAERAAELNRARHEALRSEALRIFEKARAAGEEQGEKLGFEKGYAEGVEQGRAQGREEAMKECVAEQRVLFERFSEVIHATSQSLENLNSEVGDAILALGVKIASHILNREAGVDPGRVAKDALESVLQLPGEDLSTLTLFVHPETAEIVESFAKNHPLLDKSEVRVIPDNKLMRGDVFARTAFGEVDATLSTRWKNTVANLGIDPLSNSCQEGA